MPVDEVDEVVDPLIAAYEKVDARISERLRSLASDPKQARAAARAREVQNAIDRDLAYLRKDVVPRASAAAYWSAELGASTGQVLAGASTVRFDVIDRGAVEVIAKGLQRDLLEATDTMSMSARRLIRKVGRDEALAKLIGGQTAVQAGRTMAGTLTQHGLYAVTYSNGARHGLAEYSAMAMRTTTANAYNDSLITGAAAEGVEYFECFDGPDCGLSYHGDPQLADGLVLDKATAAKYLIAHPNCRRSWGPRPDVTSKTAAADASRSTTAAQRADQIAADRARGMRIDARADKGAVSQYPTRIKYKADNAAKKAAAAKAKATSPAPTAAPKPATPAKVPTDPTKLTPAQADQLLSASNAVLEANAKAAGMSFNDYFNAVVNAKYSTKTAVKNTVTPSPAKTAAAKSKVQAKASAAKAKATKPATQGTKAAKTLPHPDLHKYHPANLTQGQLDWTIKQTYAQKVALAKNAGMTGHDYVKALNAAATGKAPATQAAKAAAQTAVNKGKVGSYRSFGTTDEMRQWGSDNFAPWANGLATADRRAVSSYTGSAYRQMNDDLRQGVPATRQAYVNETRRVTNALNAPSARLPEDVVLHRGVKSNWREFVERFDRGGFKAGDIIEDKGFMSTSLNPQVADNFGGGVVFEIRAAKGTKGAYLGDLSKFGHAEYEVLLQRGTKLRVVDVVHGRDRFGPTRKLVFEVAEQP